MCAFSSTIVRVGQLYKINKIKSYIYMNGMVELGAMQGHLRCNAIGRQLPFSLSMMYFLERGHS